MVLSGTGSRLLTPGKPERAHQLCGAVRFVGDPPLLM